MKPTGVILLVAIQLCANAFAGTRVALVAPASVKSASVIDLTIAEFRDSKSIEVLDRAQIERVLREQELSLATGAIDAERAIQAGQLLRADLFAVLEGEDATQSFGLVVFDAQTGVRYGDSAVVGSNVTSVARAAARVVETAAGKFLRRSGDLRTVGVLSVRNADLPRSFDSLCDATALLLERELASAADIAVLERRRLEHVSHERKLVNGVGEDLLSSLRVIELGFSRQGGSASASVVLTSLDEKFKARTNVSFTNVVVADWSRQLASTVARLLQVQIPGSTNNVRTEARRFGREAEVLISQSDYAAALRALNAAYALDSSNTNFQIQLVRLLPDAAIELIDPGGQRATRALTRRPSNTEISTALALGHRGMDLLLEFAASAAANTKANETVPPVLHVDAFAGFNVLFDKLTDTQAMRASYRGEAEALARKYRELCLGIIEPFRRGRVQDAASFRRFSTSGMWIGFKPNIAQLDLAWHTDAARSALHWLELSAKYNPADGSGVYRPLASMS